MPDKQQREHLEVKDRREWREWLSQNHAVSAGVWLVIYKKASGKSNITYDEAVEEALAFGWIDSRPNKLDSERFLLWLSPRKPGSVWASSNKKRVEKLILQGLMAPAGLVKVEAARRDGSWERLVNIDKLVIPPDLREALSTNEAAGRNFRAFTASVKKIILYWIDNARTPETRRRRIEETVEKAAQNIKVKP